LACLTGIFFVDSDITGESDFIIFHIYCQNLFRSSNGMYPTGLKSGRVRTVSPDGNCRLCKSLLQCCFLRTDRHNSSNVGDGMAVIMVVFCTIHINRMKLQKNENLTLYYLNTKI